ncbi:MAG: DUF938 domain-containing protein [Ramlibacter sp.]|nr:DUF938 domain-containing protein [Ramlibacter sp.]
MPHPLHSPAADRNKAPILDVLLRVLPHQGHALEIASGTGQHITWFARSTPGWTWQPTDADDNSLDSISAYIDDSNATNVLAPVMLDVTASTWPSQGPAFTTPFEAIYCANMIHIAPWSTCIGLMQGAARHLSARGVLITYGPYLESDVDTSPGNIEFDLGLRERNADWALRHLDDVKAEALRHGLALRERHAMPANNLLLVFARN